MTRRKSKILVVAGAVILLVAGVLVTLSHSWNMRHGRLKLPVGQRAPAISLGETHGIILASDVSLWSWGSDYLGWPVLGLGNVIAQSRLQRIGRETTHARNQRLFIHG